MSSLLITQGTQSAINFDLNGTINTQVVGIGYGTVSTIGTLPNLPGGSIAITSIPQISIGTLSNLPGGTLNIVSAIGTQGTIGTIQNLGSLTNVGQIYNAGTLQGGSIVVTNGTIQIGTIGTLGLGTVVNNGGSVQITDNTNNANVITPGTINAQAGQNALLTAPTGYTTGTITLSSGTLNTQWFDLLNYPWISFQLYGNVQPALLTFQTSGDPAQATTDTMPLYRGNSNVNTMDVTTTAGSAVYAGPRQGRYFRINTNLSGTNLLNLIFTFYAYPTITGLNRTQASQQGNWNIGTLGTVGTITNIGQVYNAGTIQNGTLNSIGTLGTLGLGTVQMTSGTINVGTFSNNPVPSKSIITFGTAGTLGIGTLVAAPGVGTSIYVVGYSIDADTSVLGTPEVCLSFGSVITGQGVFTRSTLVTTNNPIIQTFPFGVNGGTTNSPLTYQIISGAGSVSWNVQYFTQ